MEVKYKAFEQEISRYSHIAKMNRLKRTLSKVMNRL